MISLVFSKRGEFPSRPKEATDDRLGRLLEVIGEEESKSSCFQRQQRAMRLQRRLPLGQGFIVSLEIEAELEAGQKHTFPERWLVTQSTAHAQRQQKALLARLEKAEAELNHLRPKLSEHMADVQVRSERILKQHQVEGLLTVTVEETLTQNL